MLVLPSQYLYCLLVAGCAVSRKKRFIFAGTSKSQTVTRGRDDCFFVFQVLLFLVMWLQTCVCVQGCRPHALDGGFWGFCRQRALLEF